MFFFIRGLKIVQKNQKRFTKLSLLYFLLALHFPTGAKRHRGHRTLWSSSVTNIRKVNILLHKVQLHKMRTVQLGEGRIQRQHRASPIPKGSLKLWPSDTAHPHIQIKYKTKRQNSYICNFRGCVELCSSSYKSDCYLQVFGISRWHSFD